MNRIFKLTIGFNVFPGKVFIMFWGSVIKENAAKWSPILCFLVLTLFIPSDHLSGRALGDGPRNDLYLTWTGEEGYIVDGVEPSIGLPTDEFEFRIIYLDSSGDDPTNPTDGNFIHLVLDGETYPLTSPDQEYSDGAVFNITLTELEPGPHEYRFEASVRDELLRWPPIGNNAPILLEPMIKGGAFLETTVFPSVGNTSDLFTFQIVYEDADGDEPMEGEFSRGVYIDRVYHAMEEVNAGEDYHDGDYENGDYYDGNYSNGELFHYSTKLSLGDHQYYFEFVDDKGATTISELFPGPRTIDGYADLMVKTTGGDPDIRWTVNSTAEDWDDVTITATVENDGGSDVVEAFYVEIEIFYMDPITGQATLDEVGSRRFTVGGLAVGEEFVLEMDYTPYPQGIYEVRVVVDRNGDILEISGYRPGVPNNNNLSRRFRAGPDLSIISSDIIPPCAFNNQDVVIIVVVHNSGNTDADFNKDSEVRVTLDGLELDPVKIKKKWVIPAGGNFRAEFQAKISVDKNRESIPVSAVVDPKGRLAEAANYGGHYDNNQVESRIKVTERIFVSESPSFNPSPVLLGSILLMIGILTLYRRKNGG